MRLAARIGALLTKVQSQNAEGVDVVQAELPGGRGARTAGVVRIGILALKIIVAMSDQTLREQSVLRRVESGTRIATFVAIGAADVGGHGG
jgi:hypothetical protein